MDGARGTRGQRCGPILVTVAQNSPVDTNRSQRVIAYMIASSIGLSILAIFANLAISAAGVDKSEGLWPTIVLLPTVGLPIGFILIFVLLIMSVVTRARAARDAGKQ